MSIIKFVHFGCWNNLNVDNGTGLNQVMVKLNAYVQEQEQEQPVKFIIVAGDNYYPDKNTIGEGKDKIKTKIISPEKLSNGFNLLPDNIPINMILGNHDLETNTNTNTKKTNLFINDIDIDTPEKNDCFIIQKEIISSREKPNIELVLFKFQRINDTLVMMIDTSMYTVDTEKYLKCYNKFFENTEQQQFATKEALIGYQENQIFTAIASNMDGQLKHIIISGHHPIIGVKMKGEANVLNDIPHFKPVLQKIYEITKNLNNGLNYYYLCADLHLYQKGKINLHFSDTVDTMVINQYIVGTGGTELDNAVDADLNGGTFNNDNNDYTLEDCQCTYGFLECVLKTGVDPTFNFIQASATDSGGSKQTKRKYKKRKYKKLKSQYTRKRRRNITHKKRYK